MHTKILPKTPLQTVVCAVVLFFVVAVNFDYDRKKKDTVDCLAGARSLLRPKKKDTIVNIHFLLVQLELKLIQIR